MDHKVSGEFFYFKFSQAQNFALKNNKYEVIIRKASTRVEMRVSMHTIFPRLTTAHFVFTVA